MRFSVKNGYILSFSFTLKMTLFHFLFISLRIIVLIFTRINYLLVACGSEKVKKGFKHLGH